MDLKYSNACKEVEVLFDYFLDESDLLKISFNDMNCIRENANSKFVYVVDETKTLEEQQISKEAKAIILSLYQRYFTTEEQNAKIKNILDINKEKEEQEKREKYNPNNIFKKVNNEEKNDVEMPNNNKNTTLIEYKESFFTKFKNFILKILHINK